MIRVNKNIKLLFKYLIIPIIAAWLFYSLYRQITHQPNLAQSWHIMKKIPFSSSGWLFWLTVLLSIINIGLEGLKWKFLMRPLEKLTFWVALQSVLSGMTLSINTPNRIGEYGGRVLYIGKGKKLKSISLSITGSISQLIITLIIGCLGVICLAYYILPNGDGIIGLPEFWIRTLLIIVSIVTVAITLFYFNISWLTKTLKKWEVLKHFIPFIHYLEKYDKPFLLKVMGISFLRYIIFTSQYVLLIKAWGIDISSGIIICLIAVLFLFMAVVPSFAIADLGIRGQIGVALFGLFTTNVLGIVSAIFGIWLLNLFIPALIGSLLIITTKVFRGGKKN